MANLENLTSKIIDEAKEKAKSIIEEGKKEEEKIINKNIEKAEKEKEEILNRANIDALNKSERIISNAKLVVRNNILDAKQQTIDKVFNKACEKLEQISQGEFDEFVKNYINKLDIEGDEEIILGSSSRNKISSELLDSLNKSLKARGKRGELKIGSPRENVKEGFVLCKDGIEINCTFENLVNSNRDEFQSDIISVLFG